VIDTATRRQIGELFECQSRGAVPLKGLPEPIETFEVLAARAVQSRFEALRQNRRAPLIGRDEELDTLIRRWGQAKTGQGRFALVSGEPGIGKSRLLAALDDRLRGENLTRLRYYCSPHQQASPLHPIIGQIEFAAGFERDDPPEERRRKLRMLLAETATAAEEEALLADLLSLPAVGLPELSLSPQRRKERTFDALIRQTEQLAAQRPLLMLFEDAHWADPSTLELMDLAISRLHERRVLVVMTFGPEFQAPWTGQAGVTLIALSRLEHAEAAQLAAQITLDQVLPPALLTRIVAQADGVPLFIEELTKAVLESRAPVASDVLAVGVPETLQASLMARLDRLPVAKQVAQVGAVIGREFGYELIRAVSDIAETTLADGLEQLVASGLVFRRGEPPDARYVFKHALVQDAAYETLLRARRAALHAAIAARLEKDPDTTAAQPALLGYHYAEAGHPAQAVRFLLRAGEQAAARSAMVEARAHLDQGLVLAGEIRDEAERHLRVAELTLARGNVQMAVHGLGSREHGAAFTEAVNLCRSLRSESETATNLLARALFGNWAHVAHAGQLVASHAISEEFLALGRNHADPEIRVFSATVYATNCFLVARLQEGARVFEAAVADTETELPGTSTVDFGMDGRSLAHTIFARVLACLGFAEQAANQAYIGLERARSLHHLPTLATSLASSCTASWILRDQATLKRRSFELLELATEQGFEYWQARGKGYAGWARAADGRFADGRALLAEAVTALGNAGIPLYGPHTRAMLAGVQARMGLFDDALSTLDQALAVCARTGEVWIKAELYRQRSELLCNDPAAAELSFQQAIEIARSQSAKLFELRTAISLARLWRDRGRNDDARNLLAPIYTWFTEGFEYPDLQEARALLDELRQIS
jgi:tetratricopeptide (TPR) repeat protein